MIDGPRRGQRITRANQERELDVLKAARVLANDLLRANHLSGVVTSGLPDNGDLRSSTMCARPPIVQLRRGRREAPAA
jgi:hypothetical protein